MNEFNSFCWLRYEPIYRFEHIVAYSSGKVVAKLRLVSAPILAIEEGISLVRPIFAEKASAKNQAWNDPAESLPRATPNELAGSDT